MDADAGHSRTLLTTADRCTRGIRSLVSAVGTARWSRWIHLLLSLGSHAALAGSTCRILLVLTLDCLAALAGLARWSRLDSLARFARWCCRISFLHFSCCPHWIRSLVLLAGHTGFCCYIRSCDAPAGFSRRMSSLNALAGGGCRRILLLDSFRWTSIAYSIIYVTHATTVLLFFLLVGDGTWGKGPGVPHCCLRCTGSWPTFLCRSAAGDAP